VRDQKKDGIREAAFRKFLIDALLTAMFRVAVVAPRPDQFKDRQSAVVADEPAATTVPGGALGQITAAH
jgi:hypothetical protein